MRWGRGKAAGAKLRWTSAAEMDITWLNAKYCAHRSCAVAGQHLPPADYWHLACSGWLSIHSGLSCVSSAGLDSLGPC